MEKQIIPEQHDGKSVDLEEVATLTSEEEAKQVFERAKSRLLKPNEWKEFTGALGASFELVKNGKEEDHKIAQENDYIRIEIPGPGNAAGEGYDWVKIGKISDHPDEDAEESFGVTVCASENPQQPGEGTAHFFREGATSSFLIKRKKNSVFASYHGRNELPNTKDANLPDKLRNAVVAVAAISGISEIQWKTFIKGLLS